MKKTLSIILIMTLLSSFMLLALPTSASEPTITEAEAKQLLLKAYWFLQDTHWSVRIVTPTLKQYDPTYDIDDAGHYGTMDEARLTEGKSIAGETEYGKAVFTKELAEKYMKYTFSGLPLYVYHPSGGLFWNIDGVDSSLSPIKIDYYSAPFTDNPVVDRPNMTIDNMLLIELAGDAQKATATFVVSLFKYGFDEERDFRTMTVEYTKTEDGWRISGGQFINIICADKATKALDNARKQLPIYVPQSPSTGDETPIYIAVCAVSALTVIACGTSVARKRRREN